MLIRKIFSGIGAAGIILAAGSCGSLKSADKPAPKFERFAGWGNLKPGQFEAASEIGLTDLLSWSSNPKTLKEMIAEGKKYNIRVYTVVVPLGTWKYKYPDSPPPYQQQSPFEDFIALKLKDTNYQVKSEYQHGGEPTKSKEVWKSRKLCIHDPRTKEAMKAFIKKMLMVPELKGIAFDGIGYQNYHCCYCPASMKAFEEYYKTRTDIPVQKAFQQFSLKTLVDFNNELADYARSLKPGILIANHVWPVYQPEPLYGNRLNADYCGQTAAWFFPWKLEKIERYSRIINRDQAKYFPKARGTAMVGIYCGKAPVFPEKSPARVEEELKAILSGGCRNLQVCSINHVLKKPEIAAVFKKYCGKTAKTK